MLKQLLPWQLVLEAVFAEVMMLWQQFVASVFAAVGVKLLPAVVVAVAVEVMLLPFVAKTDVVLMKLLPWQLVLEAVSVEGLMQ